VSDEVEALLEPIDPVVRQITLEARAVVLEILPGVLEQVDLPARLIGFGRDRTLKGLVCGLALQRGYVNLMFAKGTELQDPEGLLEGTGKHARHVKLRAVEDVQRPGVRALLEQAGSLTP
jgi:hypothetical protein